MSNGPTGTCHSPYSTSCDVCGQIDHTNTPPPGRYDLALSPRWLAVSVGWILVLQAGLSTGAAVVHAIDGQMFRALIIAGLAVFAFKHGRRLIAS